MNLVSHSDLPDKLLSMPRCAFNTPRLRSSAAGMPKYLLSCMAMKRMFRSRIDIARSYR